MDGRREKISAAIREGIENGLDTEAVQVTVDETFDEIANEQAQRDERDEILGARGEDA